MERLKKLRKIDSLKEGEKIKDIFVVKFKKGIAPYSKGYSITLTLTDSSGKSIEYKYWGGQDEAKVKSIYDSIKPDSVILINGNVSNYQGKPQIVADSNSGEVKVLTIGEYDESEFIPPQRKDLDEMYSELIVKINIITNQKLKDFVAKLFKEELKENFIKHPGAIQIHHNWVGGLMQHTLEVVEYCEISAKLHPSLDKDLLIAGALLHDIGKLEELEVTSRIKGSQKGILLGHLILGIIFVAEKLKGSDIDNILADKLLHLMASHHGKLEFGSPKEAMIPEALALYYADEMSSKICEMTEFVKNSKEETEDDFMFKYNKKDSGTNIFLK